ncbi:hypothetical protein NQ315_005729 [Exocentrus adspersus]|uniref:Uncharacterized protein n=1 Tax=Exocentrus adspersus TaxID=1586481 RepID=A0AAV8VJF9_9CUCU|nr:hypothetical protein NQ315_005729 [Exocentrus adspersus]
MSYSEPQSLCGESNPGYLEISAEKLKSLKEYAVTSQESDQSWSSQGIDPMSSDMSISENNSNVVTAHNYTSKSDISYDINPDISIDLDIAQSFTNISRPLADQNVEASKLYQETEYQHSLTVLKNSATLSCDNLNGDSRHIQNLVLINTAITENNNTIEEYTVTPAANIVLTDNSGIDRISTGAIKLDCKTTPNMTNDKDDNINDTTEKVVDTTHEKSTPKINIISIYKLNQDEQFQKIDKLETKVTHFPRHLLRKHDDEGAVKEYMSLPTNETNQQKKYF